MCQILQGKKWVIDHLGPHSHFVAMKAVLDFLNVLHAGHLWPILAAVDSS